MTTLTSAGFICADALAGEPVDSNSTLDLPYQKLLRREEIRIAVPYDPTIYVNAKGEANGMSVQIRKYFEEWLSEEYKRPIKAMLVPTAPGKLIGTVDAGSADMAIGYMDEYSQQLTPSKYLYAHHANQEQLVLVSSKNAASVTNTENLSGKIVCLGRQTNESALEKQNQQLVKSGLPPIRVYRDHVALADEDLLQMVDDGLIDYTVISKRKVESWQPYLRNVNVDTNIAFEEGGTVGWLVRSNDRALSEDISEFLTSPLERKALLEFWNKNFRYEKDALTNPMAKEEIARFTSMRALFSKYGRQYHLDPLLLAAFAFQETMLNQNLISPGGAIGVMQLQPATGEAMQVGDIHLLEANIHAGAKYLSLLVSQSFAIGLDDLNRALFAMASYNMGPANVARARIEAAKKGFDPDKWFLNVEMVVAEMFGKDPMRYVRNVYKYFVVYTLHEDPSLANRLGHLKPMSN